MHHLVTTDGNKVFTTTLIIAEGVKTDHRSVFRLLKTYEDDLNDLDLSRFEIATFLIKGQPAKYAKLSEIQATFLITLMKNTKKVVQFKKQLTIEFFKQRKIIASLIEQRNNPDWQNVRKDGKTIYLQKTQVIKQFVEYATEQGSTSAKKYYMAIGTMENKGLFFLDQKYKNLREILTIKQLMQLSTADDVIEKALIDGMAKKMPYKEIFQLAKARIIAYAEIIGKSPILGLEDKAET